MIINKVKKNLSFKKNLCAVCIGAAIFCGLQSLLAGDSGANQKILFLENRIKNLEVLLEKKEEDLRNVRLLALHQNAPGDLRAANSVAEICMQIKDDQDKNNNGQPIAGNVMDSIQVLKDLGTFSVNDPRSFSEKASELLSSDSTKEKIAIISKGIFDLANDRESLPDYMLQAMYTTQSDPDLKRVIAQVLSSRGDNALIDNQITEAQARLNSESPRERQAALTHLAKTHSLNAANAIVPLLQDPEIDVKLDALLALRATGNQTHVNLVEKLLNDPDPAVSSLAKDVANHLKSLSDSARITIASADIAAELPVMGNP